MSKESYEFKSKNTKYRAVDKRLKQLNSLDVYSLSDNEIVLALKEVFEIKKVTYLLNKKYYFKTEIGYSKTHPKKTKLEYIDSRSDHDRVNYHYGTCNQYTVSGNPLFSYNNGDYESLLNEVCRLAIVNFHRCTEAKAIFDKIDLLIAEIKSENPGTKIVYNREIAEKNIKAIKLLDLENEDVVNLKLVRLNRLLTKIKEIGIQKMRKIESLKQITSYAIQAYKHKFINEGLPIELRRKKNRSNLTLKELYQEDVEERKVFFDEMKVEHESKVNGGDIRTKILNIVDTANSTDEAMELIKFEFGDMVDENLARKLIAEFRDEADVFHLKAA